MLLTLRVEEEVEAPASMQRARYSTTKSMKSIKPVQAFRQKTKGKGNVISLAKRKKKPLDSSPEEVPRSESWYSNLHKP